MMKTRNVEVFMSGRNTVHIAEKRDKRYGHVHRGSKRYKAICKSLRKARKVRWAQHETNKLPVIAKNQLPEVTVTKKHIVITIQLQ